MRLFLLLYERLEFRLVYDVDVIEVRRPLARLWIHFRLLGVHLFGVKLERLRFFDDFRCQVLLLI